jgi:hypothetical protein
MQSGRAPEVYASRARLGCDTSHVRACCYHRDIMEAIGSKRRGVGQGRPRQQPEERERLLGKPVHGACPSGSGSASGWACWPRWAWPIPASTLTSGNVPWGCLPRKSRPVCARHSSSRLLRWWYAWEDVGGAGRRFRAAACACAVPPPRVTTAPDPWRCPSAWERRNQARRQADVQPGCCTRPGDCCSPCPPALPLPLRRPRRTGTSPAMLARP